MASCEKADSIRPSPGVSHVPESNVEAVSAPNAQDDGFLSTIYSPAFSPFRPSFSPSQQGVDFDTPWDLDGINNPEQFQPTWDQSLMDLVMEPTQLQPTQDQLLMDFTMEPAPRQLTEKQWYKQMALIRYQYVMCETSLASLTDSLTHRGLPTTKAELSRKLKKWNFSKNMDKQTWQSNKRMITKRKRQGKESEVILCGKRLRKTTITKATEDHHKPNTLDLIAQSQSSPPPPTKPYLDICTPQPLPMEFEFEWPSSLPWMRFCDTFQTLAGELERSGNSNISLMANSHGMAMTIFPQTANDGFTQVQGTNTQSFVSKMAADIGKVMPEWYPGEHFFTAQVILHRPNESIPDCLKMIIYQLSNNLLSFVENEWSSLLDYLGSIGILDRIDLKGLYREHTTIKAFMESLFHQAIDWTLYGSKTQQKNVGLIRLLLRSGLDPNAPLWVTDLGEVTPLQAAADFGSTDLVELLLEFGADVNPIKVLDRSSSTLDRSAAAYAMASEHPDAIMLRIMKLLFRRGKPTDPEEILHAAINLRDMDFVKEVLSRGADVTKAIRVNYSPLFEVNALSVAIEAGEDFTRVIMDHMSAPDMLKAPFITVDVFIAAAIEGDADTIRRLHRISPIGSFRNQHGITPLRAAVSAGKLSSCEVLLDLYNGLSPTLLFLATYQGHEDVLRFLLQKGVDVNATIDWDDCGECARVCKEGTGRFEASPFPTTFCLLKCQKIRQSEAQTSCIEILIEEGARLTGGEVYWLASNWLVKPLLAALAAGGNPDEQGSSGKSALQAALQKSYHRDADQRQFEIAEALLKYGAKLHGGEIVSAIRRHETLFTLLRESGASLKDTDDDGVSALEAAIAVENPHVLQQVLQAYTGHYDPGSLCAAVQVRNLPLVDFLLTNRPRRADYHALEGTAVGIAAMSGDVDLLRKLLDYFQVDWELSSALLPPLMFLSGATSLFWRTPPGTPECFKGSPLSFAAFNADTAGFRELLGRGCRADILTWTAIAYKENFPCLEVLVGYQHRLDGLSLSALFSKPPLCIAIQRENGQMVESLLSAGANVNQYDYTQHYSRSPLQQAVESGKLKLVSCLLGKGADINAPPSVLGGATALQLAAMKGYVGLARYLLDHGARVNARGAEYKGRTALEGAAEHGRLDMLALLMDRGALTTGNGRPQFVRAVVLATRDGHHAAAGLLRQSREWTEEDEELFVSEELIDSEGNYEEFGCCEEIHESGTECIYHDFSEDEELDSEELSD